RQRPARPRPHALVSIVTRRRPPPPHLPYTTLFRSIAIAGITITDERKGAVDFTSPYYKSGTRIGVPVDNSDITSMEDLDGKTVRSEEHTSELQSRENLVCRLLLERKKRYYPSEITG